MIEIKSGDDMADIDRRNIEQAVFDWYDKQWNLPVLFLRKKALTPTQAVNTGWFPYSVEDGEEMLLDYFERFSVDQEGFHFTHYWPNEEKSYLLDLFRKRGRQRTHNRPRPLTLEMLMESAKAGRWLYE